MWKKKRKSDQQEQTPWPQDKRSRPPADRADRAPVRYDGDLTAGDEGIDDLRDDA